MTNGETSGISIYIYIPYISIYGWIVSIEYYLPIKRNAILLHATTWMTVEDIMPSERSQ